MFNVFVITIIFVILLSTFIANDFVKKKTPCLQYIFIGTKTPRKFIQMLKSRQSKQFWYRTEDTKKLNKGKAKLRERTKQCTFSFS